MKTLGLVCGAALLVVGIPACAVEGTDHEQQDAVIGSRTSALQGVDMTVSAHASGDVEATLFPAGQAQSHIVFTASELQSKGFQNVAALRTTRESDDFLSLVGQAAYARWRAEADAAKETVTPRVAGYCDSHINYCCGYCDGSLGCCTMCTAADPCRPK